MKNLPILYYALLCSFIFLRSTEQSNLSSIANIQEWRQPKNADDFNNVINVFHSHLDQKKLYTAGQEIKNLLKTGIYIAERTCFWYSDTSLCDKVSSPLTLLQLVHYDRPHAAQWMGVLLEQLIKIDTSLFNSTMTHIKVSGIQAVALKNLCLFLEEYGCIIPTDILDDIANTLPIKAHYSLSDSLYTKEMYAHVFKHLNEILPYFLNYSLKASQYMERKDTIDDVMKCKSIQQHYNRLPRTIVTYLKNRLELFDMMIIK